MRRPYQAFKEYQEFLKAFISKPMLTGSIVPSSENLAQALLSGIDFQDCKLIVEVGPGTGAVTHQILHSLPESTHYFGLDINPVFIEKLRHWYPQRSVHFHVGSAEHLKEFLDLEGLGSADYVISGLPWSLIRPHRQEHILENIHAVLKPDGEFRTFSYVHTPILRFGRGFLKLMKKFFSGRYERTVVWKNLPPAAVYRCQKQEPV